MVFRAHQASDVSSRPRGGRRVRAQYGWLLAGALLSACATADFSEPDSGAAAPDTGDAVDFGAPDGDDPQADAPVDTASDRSSDPDATPDLVADPAPDGGPDIVSDVPVDAPVTDGPPADTPPDDASVDAPTGPYRVQFIPTAGLGQLTSGAYSIRLFVGTPQPQGPAQGGGYRVTFGPAVTRPPEASE